MYEKLESCPVCNSKNLNNFYICTDYTVTQESFALTRCQKCDLVITNPRPGKEQLLKYYESADYISHTSKSTNLLNFVYKQVRKYTIHQKYKLISTYHKTGSILDYGCGTGELLQYLHKKGYTTTGYEPATVASKQAESKGLQLVGNLEKDKGTYNIITAFHVIEHVPDPKQTVKLLRTKLNSEGTLLIAVPNIDSLDAQHYQQEWAAYDVPRHLFHFNQKSFGKLIAKCKLKIVDIVPMRFDSYYVSILSERNKQNGSLFEAIKVGYQSNKAARQSKEYSSLIYVIKR